MGTKALVVDDEASVSQLVANKLKQEGFTCQTCSSVEEALSVTETTSFDLIISDLRLPKMSGLDFLQVAREKYPRTAFLIITGVDDVRVGIDAMKKGADDYLVKPLHLDAVMIAIGKALERKRLEANLENYRHNLEQMVEQRTSQLQLAMKRIEKTYDETLEALGAALDLRDTETEGHSRRVSRCCLEMAKAMKCSDEQNKQIARGSYLHDIGKIGIPDAILLKPGRLNEEETAVMQTHARVGYDLVSRIGFLAPAAEIVLTHQERFDGTGYPQGLAGHEIPLGSRIFAVADTLDAMTSDRPYRRALPFAVARIEITREAGGQFDPDVVRVFLSIPDMIWENIRREVAGARIYTTTRSPLLASAIATSALPLAKRFAPPQVGKS
jgi:response regulator RpfG family c-di-GMP phosphodiesterase